MRKIKWPVIGEYVLASHWSDHDPLDAWYVGIVVGIHIFADGVRYTIGGSDRYWRHVFRISKAEGKNWLKNFAQQTK